MSRAGASTGRRLPFGALVSPFGLATLVAAILIAVPAQARRHHRPVQQSYDPAYSSIVVDANSGAVMQQSNADSPRHPASLTKIMTLYLLFERLEAGKIKLTTELTMSPHAASMAPSKLGLKPGEQITVETAIRAIVTKSANDVAVMVGEALGGSEDEFARMMTAKAHALGMTHTSYHNCSGLPDEGQITTARDQALIGRLIQERFPKYYEYFSTRYFTFRGKVIRNHNHLLGAVNGVDGIKTGYIHESGFNIVTSVRRNGRHIIAVVFGGRTAQARDARVESLIANNINVASLKHTAPALAEAAKPEPHKEVRTASAEPVATVHAPAPGSTDPIKPNPVRTFNVKPGSLRIAALAGAPLPSSTQKLTPAPATANPAKVQTVATVKSEPTALLPPPGARPGVLGVLPAAKLASVNDSAPPPAAMRAIEVKAVAPAPAATASQAKMRGGWMIQVGAFPAETEAKERLTLAQNKAKEPLGKADPFTERVAKGDKSLFRARFAGLDKEQAEVACKQLKRSEIPCMLLRN